MNNQAAGWQRNSTNRVLVKTQKEGPSTGIEDLRGA